MVGRYLGEEAFLGSHEDGDCTHRRWSSCEEDISFPVVPRRIVLFRRNESHVKSQAEIWGSAGWPAKIDLTGLKNKEASSTAASSKMAHITQRTACLLFRTERARLVRPFAETPRADAAPRRAAGRELGSHQSLVSAPDSGGCCSQFCGNRTGLSDLSGRACTAWRGPTDGCPVAADPAAVGGGDRFTDRRGGSAVVSGSAS
jgi:hypothetical protein